MTSGALHQIQSLAVWSESEAKWRDKVTLRFPHDKHLVADGVLLLTSHPESKGDRQSRKILTCADCHTEDSDGRYMQPIPYERHCQKCHPLSVSAKLDGGLLHETPRLVQGFVHDRLTQYAKAHPEEVLGLNNESPPRLPNKRVVSQPTAVDEFEWVQQQLAGPTTDEFETNPLDGRPDNDVMTWPQRIEFICSYCHPVSENRPKLPSGDFLTFKIDRPDNPNQPLVPQRWFPHSQFRHDRYDVETLEQFQCKACHAAKDSSTSADILMPSVETC